MPPAAASAVGRLLFFCNVFGSAASPRGLGYTLRKGAWTLVSTAFPSYLETAYLLCKKS